MGENTWLTSVTAAQSTSIHWNKIHTCNKLYENASKCMQVYGNNTNKQKWGSWWKKFWKCLSLFSSRSSQPIFHNVRDQYKQNNFATFTYGGEKWLLTLREDPKFQVTWNKVRKIFGSTRDEVTEQLRIIHNEELVTHTGLLRSTQPSIQWVPGCFPAGSVVRMWS